MSIFAIRCERLQKIICDEGVELALITNPINVTYLTGFSGDASNLIVTPTKTLLVSDGRFKVQIEEECPGLEAFIRGPARLTVDVTIEQMKSFSPRSIGIESGHLTMADFDTFKEGIKTADWKLASDRVEKLRMIKDDTEVAQIRSAIRIAERAFAMFRAGLKPSYTEVDMGHAMESFIRQAGGSESAFPVIAAVGPRSALPHAPPSLSAMQEHRLLLVDWGASGPFYKSDLTRILWTYNNLQFPNGCAIPDKVRNVHAVVKEAQRRAIAAMRPGASTKEIDTIARGYIADQGFGELFNHGLGHGFGLQIHEPPFFRPSVDVTLAAGMVVTCEPGIYLQGEFGIRIEDDILITPDGAEILTHCPRELDASIVEF